MGSKLKEQAHRMQDAEAYLAQLDQLLVKARDIVGILQRTHRELQDAILEEEAAS